MTQPSQPDSSADLVERTRRKEPAAIDELLVRELPALRAYVRLNVDDLLRAKESCSDLVQSVCREVLEHAEGFEYRGPEAFRGWLYQWTLNKVRERRKHFLAAKRSPEREAVPDGPGAASRTLDELYRTVHSPSQEAVGHERAELLERAFDALPDHYREVVTLARIVGLGHDQIAARTGQAPASVRGLLHRALARLATELDRVRQARGQDQR